ncbi:MAG: beta-galactosidase, partial [Phycisphaerae bacterium]|nr:beta-galactosidase [Phycisphaerae bacterium]
SDGKKKRGINLYNPRVRKLFDKYLDALAGHIKDKWNDVIVGMDLESGYKFDLAGYDYSPFADAEWQKWVKARYGSVDKMNQAWGTKIAGWDKVEQPRERPKDSPRLALDWFSWREKYLADYFEFQYRRLGKLLPDMLIGVRDEFRDQHGMFVRPEAAKDVHKIVRQASDIGMHGGMSAFLDDFLRGVSEGKWLYNWHTAICFGSVTGQVMYTSFFKDVIGEYISGGAGGILRHNYTWFLDRHMDRQIKIDSIGSYFIPLREMKYVAPQILNTEVRSDIAVLWPKVSMKTGGSPAETEAIAMACILTYAGHTGDYLTEEQINRGRLAKYKVLILPSARHLPAETVAKIREYVNNGGSLLALTNSSLGATGKKFALADVYGADHGGRIFWQPLGTVDKDKNFRILVSLPRNQKGLFYARKISKYWKSFHHYQPRNGAKVIAVYPGGQAAAVKRRLHGMLQLHTTIHFCGVSPHPKSTKNRK